VGEPWLEADFGAAGAGLALVLLAYYVVGEPLLGRWAADRLRRRRPSDPAALVAFYRLTVNCLWASAAVVALVVVVEPDLTLREIGVAWPQLPGGVALPIAVGAFVGVAGGIVAGLVIARRGATSSAAAPPEHIAFMLPATSRERGWAAGVAVTAGITEEVVFRGLFLALGIGLFGVSPLLAAILVSAVFGLAHVYQGAVGVLGTALLGGVLAALALGTESLLPAILLHVLVDLRSLLLVPERA